MTSTEHLSFDKAGSANGSGHTTDQETPMTETTGEPATRTAADRFFGAVRRTRLVRSRDRWIAGVAGGVAERAGVNPNVVRVAFLVLSLFGGIGLGLYGLAWLLLPDATGRIEAQQAVQRGDVSGALVLAVGLVVLDLVVGNGLLGLGWVF
ncbi:PspC domain-containing protein [Kineococcus aurantiacus]|uniref:Phage shock protein PspC (Stress-responsive transcriptional regulator) n=1 Tax=Kineococcus aurantiacus TaxID=37633 RepID=A0A7Y9DKQ6_9ACTN|nr:PspC domain-containing protein [Kineococcus aurantiacus]NYD22392.1 phage shock protein PspC (stress-responsive transcriptional regulator) [Kineococcus aurantiacus]